MAEYSYWFYKASENMQVGFCIYHIAEVKVKEKLRDMSFAKLVKSVPFYQDRMDQTNFLFNQNKALDK